MDGNRRQHIRYPISLAGEIEYQQRTVEAEASNLSLGGVGFLVRGSLPNGTRVKLTLFLVEDGIEDGYNAPLRSEAVVSWSAEHAKAGYYIGFRFEQMDDGGRQQLQRYIRRLEDVQT